MSGPGDGPRLALTVLFAAWAMAYAYAFVAFATTSPEADAFTRGLNRVSAFLGWQGVAGALSLAVFAVSRGWPKGAAVRRIGAVPLLLALALVAAIAGVIVWARLAG